MDIKGNKNTQVQGDGNHIGDVNHYYTTQDVQTTVKHKIQSSYESFRNPNIDYVWMVICLIVFIFAPKIPISYDKALVVIALFGVVCYFYLPYKIDSMIIGVYSDRVEVGDKVIVEYQEIRRYTHQGQNFIYKKHDDPREYHIKFHTPNGAEFLYYKVDSFAEYYNTKIK
ncbi:MAG: hypothetical protein RBR23_01495 [Arcobacteraceae bacterium]|jgi:hypothetical protein|nr:hypothetical protein [Arcobacteraceae bacterium]